MEFVQWGRPIIKSSQYFNNWSLSDGVSVEIISYSVLFCMLIFLIWVPSIQGDNTVFLLDYRSGDFAIILMNDSNHIIIITIFILEKCVSTPCINMFYLKIKTIDTFTTDLWKLGRRKKIKRKQGRNYPYKVYFILRFILGVMQLNYFLMAKTSLVPSELL